MSYAFIGPYFLSPYYARFTEALNLASNHVVETSGSHGANRPLPYTLVRAKNVGMTSILLFARDPTSISQIEEAECGFGAADMGNKGAVGLRVTWTSPQQPSRYDTTGAVERPKSTELTFVATHLAAMEWNLKKRNANWRSIVSGLTFSNPRSVLPGVFPANRSGIETPDRSGAGDKAPRPPPSSGSVDSSEAEEEGEEDDEPLLASSSYALESDTQPLTPSQSASLQDISIFKPTSHLFVAGDLNYRISSTTPPPLAQFPSFDPNSPNHHSHFFGRDQLTQERLAGRAFHGMEEAPVTFGPTYKFDILDSPTGAVNEAAVRKGQKINGVPEVPWKFAPHRWPGWCDRVLFTGHEELKVGGYDAFPVLESSDHRPVWLRVSVPIVGGDEMKMRLGLKGAENDPRKKLPVPVDVDAWERRMAARRKEVVVGWSALLWSTKEGAVALATVLVMILGGWWLFR